MKKKLLLFFVTAFSFIFLSGCDTVLRHEFLSNEHHEAAPIESRVSSQMTSISDYDSLQQALLSAMEAHNSILSVKLTGYSGDVEQDIKDAIDYVLSTNLAIYGVEDISYESTLILSYYEINFTFTYSKTKEQFYDIAPVSSMSQFKTAVGDCLRAFGTETTLALNDFNPLDYDLNDVILQLYYSDPFYAIGLVSFDITYYPSKGDNCIMNIQFVYSDSYSMLTTKRLQSEDMYKRIIEGYTGRDNDQEKLKYLHDVLCSNCYYISTNEAYNTHKNITPDDSFTMYGALVKGEACSYGYSLALHALCDYFNISNILIHGSVDGEKVQWNMVYLGYDWYHVDCAADDISDEIYGYGSFCVPDRIFDHFYTWPASEHGSCTSSNVRYNFDFPDDVKWLSRYNPSGIEPTSASY